MVKRVESIDTADSEHVRSHSDSTTLVNADSSLRVPTGDDGVCNQEYDVVGEEYLEYMLVDSQGHPSCQGMVNSAMGHGRDEGIAPSIYILLTKVVQTYSRYYRKRC